MKNIKHILAGIEKNENIRILYACETGSRAWGFPSPDSDYDIRFIYMHQMDWYLSLSAKKDTIEIMDGDLDITGWDLKKCLQLLKRSNAPLIERFQSPVTYHAVNGFKHDFNELIRAYYSPIAVFFHHHSLAKKFWEDLKDKTEFKLKSYFYLIRSLLSCKWIMQDNLVLPMDIEGLMRYIDDELRNELRGLIKLKATVGEKYLCARNELLHEWILANFETIEQVKEGLAVNKMDMSLLNDFFLKMLYEKNNN